MVVRSLTSVKQVGINGWHFVFSEIAVFVLICKFIVLSHFYSNAARCLNIQLITEFHPQNIPVHAFTMLIFNRRTELISITCFCYCAVMFK